MLNQIRQRRLMHLTDGVLNLLPPQTDIPGDDILHGRLTPVFSFITGILPVSHTDYRFSMMVISFAILAHAVLQSSWGSTPGKAILGYKIRTRTGHKLSFREAISREARIAWNGLGFGIPLYSFFTQLKAFTDLNNTGETSWDKAGDLVVTHR